MIQNTLDENQFQFFSNFKRITREIDRDITIYNRKGKRIGIETRKKGTIERKGGKERKEKKKRTSIERISPIQFGHRGYFFFFLLLTNSYCENRSYRARGKGRIPSNCGTTVAESCSFP